MAHIAKKNIGAGIPPRAKAAGSPARRLMNMNASPDNMQTGERLATIETLLQTVVHDLKEIKDDLKNKASSAELQVVHERIDKVKVEVNKLEVEVFEQGKDVATLQASRKTDFFWMSGIAAFLGILSGIAGAIIAALIQKGG